MTHEPDEDPTGEEMETPPDVDAIELEGVPMGDSEPESIDFNPDDELQKAIDLKDSEADVSIDVVVQMGHVARTTGKTGTAGEQDFARAAAAHTAGRLAADGRVVQVIGADDPIPRSEVFVAIHCDGSENQAARGASVGFRNENGRRAAHAWKAAYQRLGWQSFRADNYTAGLRDYYGTRKAKDAGTPFAFILEAGFLTNPNDRALLANQAGHIRCAEAIRQAVNSVLGGGSALVNVPSPTTNREDLEMVIIQHDGPGGGIALLSGGKFTMLPTSQLVGKLTALGATGPKSVDAQTWEFLKSI